MESVVKSCIAEKPDLIVLPEACDRYHNYPLSRRLEYYEVRGDRLLRFFKEKAYENSCYIAYSAVRKLEDGTYRNTTQLIDRKGEIAGLYNKNHPTIGETEDGKILPGRMLALFRATSERLPAPFALI